MNWPLLFIKTMLVLDAGAVVSYAWQRDWHHALYWLFAAGITVVVTW